MSTSHHCEVSSNFVDDRIREPQLHDRVVEGVALNAIEIGGASGATVAIANVESSSVASAIAWIGAIVQRIVNVTQVIDARTRKALATMAEGTDALVVTRRASSIRHRLLVLDGHHAGGGVVGVDGVLTARTEQVDGAGLRAAGHCEKDR